MLKLNKFLKILLFSLIIIFIFGSIFFLFENKSKITDIIGIQFLKIKSNSMSPTFCINDIVLVQKSKDYNVGDIITYDYENKYLVTHRIVKKENENFITKGDNNNSEDMEKIKIEDVKGKVILIIKNKDLKKIIIISIIVIIFFEIFKKGLYYEKIN